MKALSVIICTADRPESLHETLTSLANTEREGVDMEVRVVDNGKSRKAGDVVREISETLTISYLVEEKEGKAHCLNRAVRSMPLKEIAAILDDDISVDPKWLRGVSAIASRWPEKGFFTGRTLVQWPVEEEEIPHWARRFSIRRWAFSAWDDGRIEHELHPGLWFPGGHFWFRSKLLPPDYDFAAYEPYGEPRFMLFLSSSGHGGVAAPDAVAWHRVQRRLLDLNRQRRRAWVIGRLFGISRLSEPQAGSGIYPDLSRRLGIFRFAFFILSMVFLLSYGICRVIGGSRRLVIIQLKLLQKSGKMYQYGRFLKW